jgi:hypothetical protein
MRVREAHNFFPWKGYRIGLREKGGQMSAKLLRN